MRIHRPGLLTAIWLAFISLVIGGIILIIAWIHIGDTVRDNQHRSDMRWCTLLHQISYPRGTAAGERFTAALQQLELEFRCSR
jgi:hypothetical protein